MRSSSALSFLCLYLLPFSKYQEWEEKQEQLAWSQGLVSKEKWMRWRETRKETREADKRGIPCQSGVTVGYPSERKGC